MIMGRCLRLMVLILLLDACAHHEVKVDCDEVLKPINRAAPKEDLHNSPESGSPP